MFVAMAGTNLTTPLRPINQSLIICREKHSLHPFGVFYGENPLDYSFPLMLLQIAMVMVITRITYLILKPLKQPKVVSETIAGIIIGPSVLGQNKKFAKHVFPESASYLMKNVGLMGFMYFVFISGVKMDLSAINKAGKKQWYIALFGVLIPLCTSGAVALAMRNELEKELAKYSSIWGIISALAITTFPVLYPIIREFNLLSSELGRMALSTAIISDVIGINGLVAFEAAKQGEGRTMAALWYVISLVILMVSLIGGMRQAMLWIVKTTPEGKPVDQIYVIVLLLGVVVVAFLSDMFGLAIGNAPMWLGLAVPDGPPLGSTIVDRSETIIMGLLMPFAYAFVGLNTDVFSMRGHWSKLLPVFLMALTAYVAKFLATFILTRLFHMPVRDGLALSLIMSLRGQIELLLFMHWTDLKMITQPYFTMLVLLTTTVTAVAAPFISVLYDPTKPYMVNKRRNIQHNPPNAPLNIVACIHDEESTAGMINLLEVSNPTAFSPFSVYALRLVELVGRAAPYFIDHEAQEGGSEHATANSINNALNLFQESRGEYINMHFFTSVSPKRSMYQDICELALEKRSSLILLPFHKECLDNLGTTELVRHGVQSVNDNVLSHAPCSVAILVERGALRNNYTNRASGSPVHNLAVLFLGGADAREALVYADRMAGNPEVSLTVIRFLAQNNEGDNEMEKKLDDGLVTWFWVKNEGNDRVNYREVVVNNGQETVTAIQTLSQDCFDLWILGRKHGINPTLLQGLSNWSENNELGVIGDYVASTDLGSIASVLVVQQQVLRDQKNVPGGMLERITSCTY